MQNNYKLLLSRSNLREVTLRSLRKTFLWVSYYSIVRITRSSFPETFVLSPCESHEIFIKTKSVITTRIIPRGLDPREIATPLFHSTPSPTIFSLYLSLSVLRDTTWTRAPEHRAIAGTELPTGRVVSMVSLEQTWTRWLAPINSRSVKGSHMRPTRARREFDCTYPSCTAVGACNSGKWTTDLRNNDFVVPFTYTDSSGRISASITLNGKLFDRRLFEKDAGGRGREARAEGSERNYGLHYWTLYASMWVSFTTMQLVLFEFAD